jgi:hypothetical protein
MFGKIGLTALAMLALVIFAGCSKEESNPPVAPTITTPTITPIAYDDSIRLVWNKSAESGESGFVGYGLYIANVNLASIGTTDTSYRIWTTPQNETTFLVSQFDGNPLDSNAIYYFGIYAVRTVDSGDTTSPFSVFQMSPVILGNGRIYEFASDSVCAFNFAEARAITKLETSPSPDIYLADYPAGVTGLAVQSPSVSGVPSWTGSTVFKQLGTGNLKDYPQTEDAAFTAFVDVTTKVYAIKTSTNHFVKLVIVSFGGISPNRYIEFQYKYQTLPNYPHF